MSAGTPNSPGGPFAGTAEAPENSLRTLGLMRTASMREEFSLESAPASPSFTPAGSIMVEAENTTEPICNCEHGKAPGEAEDPPQPPQSTEQPAEKMPESVVLELQDRVAGLQQEVEDFRAKEQRHQEQLAELQDKQSSERSVWQAKMLGLEHEISELQAQNHAHDIEFSEVTAELNETAKRERKNAKKELQAETVEKETALETVARLRRRIARREKEAAVQQNENARVEEEMRSLQKGIRRLYEDSRGKELWDGDSTPDGSESSPDE